MRLPAPRGLRQRGGSSGTRNEILNLGLQDPSGGTRATAVNVPVASGARRSPPRAPSPLTTCTSRAQAFDADGSCARRLDRGASSMRRQEEERSPPARRIGTSGVLLLRVERDEVPTGLLCPQAVPERAASCWWPARASCLACVRGDARGSCAARCCCGSDGHLPSAGQRRHRVAGFVCVWVARMGVYRGAGSGCHRRAACPEYRRL